MIEKNQTHLHEILLLGFQAQDYWKDILFILLFIVYCMTILGNFLIIILVVFCKTLHSPMYMFLAQLSVLDILLISDITPNTLAGILSDGTILSFSGCITQLYVFGSCEASECALLTAMGYDRYLAICNPLRYPSIMNTTLFVKLSLFSWVIGFFVSILTILSLFTLDFCGPHIIDHYFCDLDPLLLLSCTETFTVRLNEDVLVFFAVVLPMVLTGTSYGCIVRTVLGMSSNIDRWKAFSTCGSHLTVVCIFYGTLIVVYIIPTKGFSSIISKLISLLYTMVTPMVNPIIYSLRNKDIKAAMNIFLKSPVHV